MALSKIEADSLDIGQVGGRRNLIINGAMQVAQRGTSVTVGGVGGSGYRAVDRFSVFNPIDLIAEQSSDSPDGFTYSCKITKNTTSTTSTSSIGGFRYGVELQDIYQLAYGTSSAKTITLSFYVKSSHAGTYNVLALNHGGDTQRQLTKLYTIDSTDTWEYKTLTFSGDTAFAGHTDASNTMGISLDFICTPSTAWGNGTVNTSGWADNVTSSRISTSQANALQSNGDYFAITGVQLEVGSVATPFEHRSYGEELQLCKRYFQIVQSSVTPLIATGHAYNTSTSYFPFRFEQEMRDAPGVTSTVDSGNGFRFRSGGTTHDKTGIPIRENIDTKGCRFANNQNTITTGSVWDIQIISSTAKINMDAEL